MANNDYMYKVSVIVPVYNAMDFLEVSINSLINQTFFSEMEVLLVDDGSSDGSLEMCLMFSDNYNNIITLSQKNEGVSRARNLGIKKSRGKYIMFLDADDELSAETVASVYTFFEKVYDQVDVVTYPERKYANNTAKPLHFRYQFLKTTGIYDLNHDIYVTQSRINIAIKNERNKEYFSEKLESAEDQEFIARLLSKKMKLGFVNKGMYKYNLHSLGVTSEKGYIFYTANVIQDYYKKMFDSFALGVPKYFQAMFLYDINWKICQDQLWPYHYDDEKLNEYKEDVITLLQKCDLDVLIKHPALDLFHKFYLLQLMNRPINVIATQNELQVVCKENILYRENKCLIVVTQMKIYNGQLKLLAHLKSPAYAFTAKPILYAYLNNKKSEPSLFTSSTSRYKSKIKTNQFWGFYFEIDLEIEETNRLYFTVQIDGIEYDTKYYFMPYTPFNLDKNYLYFINGNYFVEFRDQGFDISQKSNDELKAIIDERTKDIFFNASKNDNSNFNLLHNASEIYSIRKSFNIKLDQKIWLYYDCKGVDCDNGYYQFINDFERDDGISRYYINNNANLKEELFKEKHKHYVIDFGSEYHKKLFINADKILTAYVEKNNIYPFDAEQMQYIKELLHFETIYLQHGILHASIPWKYSPECLQIDKVVVSSAFEENNFFKNYNFRKQDIYATGMPRFDLLHRNKTPQNRILFAPSWRNYLIHPQVKNYWEPMYKTFLNSDYFKKINSFLDSDELNDFLEKYNMFLDFKLHPIFKTAYKECFSWRSNRIAFSNNSVDDEDYEIFITDFSSYVFDFAYLERAIIYFIPDYLQFKSGMNQYRQMDLSFEESFGPLITEGPDVIKYLYKLSCINCKPEPIYKERMSKFFINKNHRASALYTKIKETEFK